MVEEPGQGVGAVDRGGDRLRLPGRVRPARRPRQRRQGAGVLPQAGSTQTPLAWYEAKAGAWVKHVVTPQSYGHGIGAGDVNKDGRTDILTPRGWAEAPADPRSGPVDLPCRTGKPSTCPPPAPGRARKRRRRTAARHRPGIHARRGRQRRRPQRRRHRRRPRLRRVLVRAGRRRQMDAPDDRRRLVAGARVDAGRSERRRPTGLRDRQALHGAQRQRSRRTRAARRLLVRASSGRAVCPPAPRLASSGSATSSTSAGGWAAACRFRSSTSTATAISMSICAGKSGLFLAENALQGARRRCAERRQESGDRAIARSVIGNRAIG